MEEKTFKESMINTKRATSELTGFLRNNDASEATYRLIDILKANSSFYAHIFIA
jgi:hypothetical protein